MDAKKKRFLLIGAAVLLMLCVVLLIVLFLGKTSAPASDVQDRSVSLNAYTSEELCFTIGIPSGYEVETFPGEVTIQNDTSHLTIGCLMYINDSALYSLSDIAAIQEEILAEVISGSSAKSHQLLSGETTEINGEPAYLIRYAAQTQTASGEGIVAMVPLKNGFGCYVLSAAWEQGDATGQAEIEAAAASFKSTGIITTNLALFSDEKLGFNMLYDTAVVKGGYSIQTASQGYYDCVFFYPDEGNEGVLLEVECAAPYAKDAEDAMAYFHEKVFAEIDPNAAASELYDIEIGDTTFLLREYAVEVYGFELTVGYCAVDMGGTCYAMCAVTDAENREAILQMLQLATHTLRPL